MKYDVAAYIWPSYTGDEPRSRMFWPEGYGEWQTVKAAEPRFPGHEWPRKPLWGYVNEADPYVMEMQIEAAASHGVNVFIYDWYWYDNRPFLEQCLDNGYLGARNNDKVKFYLMWANHTATTAWDKRTAHLDVPIWRHHADTATFRTIVDRVIGMYFKHPSYYKIDNKPVFNIHDLSNFIIGMGGVDNAKRAIYEMNDKCIAAGFDGVHTQITLRSPHNMGFSDRQILGFDGSVADAISEIGIDSTTHYQLCAYVEKHTPYLETVDYMAKTWDESRKNYAGTYYPHVSLGWDPTPRYIPLRDDIVYDAKPEYVKKALQLAKEYLDTHKLPVPLVTINSWNEWTETSYLEPDDKYGYGYLEAVRDVFMNDN